MGDRRGSDPSEMTDDDSISITSTLASDQYEEYVVEGIIAERDNDGIMEYLVRWEGYPDERCTWEPRSSFQDESTMLDWETQKMRVSRGYAQPCDVEALLNRVEKWIVSTNQRTARRRAKRLRLGLPVTPIETNVDEEDSEEKSEQSSVEEEYDLESPVGETSFKSKTASLSSSREKSGSKEKLSSSSRSIAPVAKMAQNWTEEEEKALVDGLHRLKGPHFQLILDLHGPAGTVSQVLKEKSVPELQEKTQKLCEECQELGMETPSYLCDVPGAQYTESNRMQVPGKAPTAVMSRPQKMDSGSGGSKSTSASSNTSPTDISFGEAGNARQQDQATGLPKQRSSAAKSSPTRSKVGIDRRGSLSGKNPPETEQASKLSSASSPKHAFPTLRRASPADPDSLRKTPREPFLPNLVSPAIQNPRRGSLPEPRSKPPVTSSKTSRRSSKINAEEPNGMRKTQMGSSGRGPARLSLSPRKPSKPSSKKVSVSGAAILSNWNKDVKRRKSNAFQPGTSEKPSQKFSVVRRYIKRGRNEPAPNIEMLTFMNLKHGGVAKKPPPATPKLNPPKTPFQLIQESLKADADAPPQIESTSKSSPEPNLDNESPHRVSPDSNVGQIANSDIPGSNPTQNDPILASPLEAPTGLGRNSKKGPLSVSQDHLEQKSTSRPPLPSPKPTEDVRLSEVLPPQDAPAIPRGPRNERSPSNASRSSDTIAPSRDKSAFAAEPAKWSKGTSYSRPYAPTQTTSTIPYGPTTQAQKNLATPAQTKLMNSGVENDILGNILVGQDGKDLGDVRFRGLDRPARQLFLTIKIPPRRVHVTCTYICTIGEYQEFYLGVSGVLSVRDLNEAGFNMLFRNRTTTLAVASWYRFGRALGPYGIWLKFSRLKLRVLFSIPKIFLYCFIQLTLAWNLGVS